MKRLLLTSIFFFLNCFASPAWAYQPTSNGVLYDRGDTSWDLCRDLVEIAAPGLKNPSQCLRIVGKENTGIDLGKIRVGQEIRLPGAILKHLKAHMAPTVSAEPRSAQAPTPPAPATVVAASSPTPAAIALVPAIPPPYNGVAAAPPVDSQGNPVVVQDTRNNRGDMGALAAHAGVPTLPRPTTPTITASPKIGVSVYPDKSPTLKELLQRRQVAEIELTRKLNELARHKVDLATNAKVPTGRSPQAYGISFKIFPQDGWENKWENFEREQAIVQGEEKQQDLLKEIGVLRARIAATDATIAELRHKKKA